MVKEQANQTATKEKPTNRKRYRRTKRSGKFSDDKISAKKVTKNNEDRGKKRKEKQKRPARVRIFPIWLRLLVVTALVLFALVAGLMIGFGVLGDGEPLDALKVETWQHIIDIIGAE